MKKIVSIVLLITMLIMGILFLTGCTLTLETTDNSVSASVDGETTEKVDGILDWIKERFSRVFDVEVKTKVDTDSITVTTTGASEKI